MEKKLQRIPHEGAVAGVCAGLGVYFGVDKTWVRLAFVISVFFSGYMGIGLLGPIIYVVLWIVLPVQAFSMPRDPFDVNYRTESTESEASETFGNPPIWDTASKPRRSAASKDRYIAGLILLAVGIFFLLHQLDLFYWRDFARYWPVLIIIMGFASIFGAFNGKKQRAQPFEKKDNGYMEESQPPTEEGGEGSLNDQK